MKAVLGLDTSNYCTSAAIVSLKGEILFQQRKLMPVSSGERGLRQSDAVYAHLKQIKPILIDLGSALSSHSLIAVCASTAPRALKDSYMPVFEVGDTIGRGIAASMGIPFFQTDHQHGHIRAACHETVLESEHTFLALHLSGGTTDLLDVSPDKLQLLGTSLDLHAGQLIDRTGVSMGCGFPAGPEMEHLAFNGRSQGLLGCSMDNNGLSCHLSGAESQVQRWIQQKAYSREIIAREVFDLLARTSARMLHAGMQMTGHQSALVFGGIASSALFRNMLTDRMIKMRSGLQLVFGRSELSGDNAAGVALIGADQMNHFLRDSKEDQ